MLKKRLFCFAIICIIFVSCSTKYTPVEHSFKNLDRIEAVSQISPFLLNSVYQDDGIFFSSWVNDEKWFARDYFQQFPEEFEKNYVLTNVYTRNTGQHRLVYRNRNCTKDEETCVRSLLFVFGPPQNRSTPDKVIFSCKLEKKSAVHYQLSEFPVRISFFMKGNDRGKLFAELEDVYMEDFEKYEKLIQMIKSIYPEHKIACW